MISRSLTKDVSDSESTIFLVIGANAYGMSIFLQNSGQNDVTYKFQEATENSDPSFADITGESGILAAGSVVLHKIDSSLPYIRLRAWAAGGSDLMIGVSQWVLNTSNVLPILNI